MEPLPVPQALSHLVRTGYPREHHTNGATGVVTGGVARGVSSRAEEPQALAFSQLRQCTWMA